MITASLDLPSTAAAHRPAPLLPSARWLLGRLLTVTKWFIGIVAVAFIAALTMIGADLPFSIWENFVSSGPAWFALAMGATAVTSYLPVVIAQGVTRGRFVTAATLAVMALSALLALFALLGIAVEGVLNQRLGWNMVLVGDHLFDARSQFFLVFAEYFTRYLLFAMVGLLVGYGFYRTGGWWGTLLLLLTGIVPLGLGNILLNQDIEIIRQGFASVTFVWVGLTTATGVGLVLTLVFLALLFVVTQALLKTVPIRVKAG